jgi:membrane protein DedA with SNARE-associated domain
MILVLGALVNVPSRLGYLALGGLIAAESGGLPVPGETALVTAGVLSQQDKLEIWIVIVVAASAAIIGDNIGYAVSRRVGRRLLERPGRTQQRRLALLDRGERFFERHGAKAVFFGRWIAGLRIWASWLAGITGMHWRTFLLWNALGGITWAITVGLAGYAIGKTAETVIQTAGLAVGITAVVLAVTAYAVWHWRRRRRHTSESEA